MAGFFINWTATLIAHTNFQFLWGPMTLAVTMEMNCDIIHHCHCEGQRPVAIQTIKNCCYFFSNVLIFYHHEH